MSSIRKLLHQSRSMAKFSDCRNELSVTLLDDVPEPSKVVFNPFISYRITLKFSCEVVLAQTVIHNGSVFGYEVDLPERVTDGEIYLQKPSDLETPQYQEILKSMIREWLGVSNHDAYRMSADVTQSAVEIITSSALPAGHGWAFTIPFKFSLVHAHVLVPRTLEDGEQLFLEMMEQTTADPQMVPATDECINNLKRGTVEDDCEGDCVICLEKFSEGHETASMPCSHSFHGDCIEEWLSTSHYCPICRFKMSTD